MSAEQRPLTIVSVHTSDQGGGAEALLMALHRKLRDMGHRSLVFVGKKRGDDPDVTEIPRRHGFPGGQRIARFLERTTGLQYLYAPGFRGLSSMLPHDLDVLQIRGLHGAEGFADVGGLPRLTRGRPCLLWFDDMWMLTGHCAHSLSCERWRTACGRCPDLSIYPSVPKDATRLNWHRKKHVIARCDALWMAAPSQWLADRISASPIFGHRPVSVVPNGIDISVFKPGDRKAARQLLGIPFDQVTVLVAAQHMDGRFRATRDAIRALNATAGVDRLGALLVGHASEAFASEVAIPCRSLPYQNRPTDMARCYQAADILVIPSMGETFGLVAAEAMACGCAVVAYNTGGLPEVIGAGDTGILVSCGDVKGLACALRELGQDMAETHALGQRASGRATQLFSAEVQAAAMVELYRRMITERVGAVRRGP